MQRRDATGCMWKCAGTTTARRTHQQGYLLHPVPVWSYDAIGMTNQPESSEAPVWTNCQPVQPDFMKTTLPDYLLTPASRARAFDEMLDPLMKPVSQGGRGLGINAALAELSEDNRELFNARLDMLMRPKPDGTSLTLDEALAEMRRSSIDAKLLRAMGAHGGLGEGPETHPPL